MKIRLSYCLTAVRNLNDNHLVLAGVSYAAALASIAVAGWSARVGNVGGLVLGMLAVAWNAVGAIQQERLIARKRIAAGQGGAR